MAKKELSKDTTSATPEPLMPWMPMVPNTAVLEVDDRTVDLHVAGNRQMQISLDKVELGVGEINLALPGIKVRIAL